MESLFSGERAQPIMSYPVFAQQSVRESRDVTGTARPPDRGHSEEDPVGHWSVVSGIYVACPLPNQVSAERVLELTQSLTETRNQL